MALAALTVGAWLSAGATPVIRAALRAPAPNDFTPDYVAAHAWLHGGARGPGGAAVLDGPAGNAYAASIGAPPVLLLAAYYVHPPTAFLALMPLVPLGYWSAALAWLLLSIIAAGALAVLLRATAERGARGPRTSMLFPLLLLWPPMLTNIQLGQWSIFLALAIAGGYAAWSRGHPRQSGVLIGAAVALKLTPILLVPFMALRDRRVLLASFATLAAVAALSLATGQLDAWRSFFAHSGENLAVWQTYRDNTLSIWGLLARLLVGGRFAHPLVVAPTLARILEIAILGAIGGTALWFTGYRPDAATDRERDGCRFALWVIFIVVANPLAWSHYALLLLLPIAMVVRGAEKARQDVALRMRGLAAGAFILLTIPKETIYWLSDPGPVSPGRGLLVSTHLYGALLLFAAAAIGTRATTPAGPDGPPPAAR